MLLNHTLPLTSRLHTAPIAVSRVEFNIVTGVLAIMTYARDVTNVGMVADVVGGEALAHVSIWKA